MWASSESVGEGEVAAISPSPLLLMHGIAKSFPGVHALRGVDFDLNAGEIHCLVGENGAGKSTLMRVLAGAQTPDAGEIILNGERLAALSPALGHRLGIGMIYQEADLVLSMSILDNIFLGHEEARHGVFLQKRQMRAKVEALFAQLNLDFKLDALVRDLAPAQRQLVQIVKALSREIRILVLDEPTAALTDNEIDYLFDLLRSLRERGIGMVYVSHRLSEILSIGDRVTVLRDGLRVTTEQVADVTREGLIAAMVGRAVDADARSGSARTETVVMRVRDLGVQDQFSDVSFDLHRGEILGIGGLVGAGRSEVLECLFGVTRPDSGSVEIDGKPATISGPADAIRLGLGLVPEERRESGLVLARPVAENITFPVLGTVPRGRLRALAAELVQRLGVKTPSLRQLVRTLSGGNQQKVVIGKWLAADVRILLLDEPTRGIDVNAKFEIYRLTRDLAKKGVSIVMVSSDLPELLALSDRILVMADGRPVTIMDGALTDQVEVMRHAVARTKASGAAA